jgi:hypothetical protein
VCTDKATLPNTQTQVEQNEPMETDEPTPLPPSEPAPTGTTDGTHTKTPHKTKVVNLKYTYQILVKAQAGDTKESFTKLNVLQTLLRALQASDPSTCIIIPGDSNYSPRTYSKLNQNSKNTREYQKIENLLNYNTNGALQGNIQITTNTMYSTMKKNPDTKKLLQESCNIHLNLNNILSTNLVEVGFLFII